MSDETPQALRLRELQESLRNLQEVVGRGKGGREYALVQTKLDEARLWLQEAERVMSEG